MKCKQCQQKILESLAAGVAAMPKAVAFHQNSCADCIAFQHSQQNLFRSIDDGLHSLVNRPMPPSVLANVRGRLVTTDSTNSMVLAWAPVAVVLLLAALIAVPYFLNWIGVPNPQVAAGLTGNQLAGHLQPPINSANTVSEPNSQQIARIPSRKNIRPRIENSVNHADVLTDQQEAQALTRLANAICREPGRGKALLHPSALPPVEISVLSPVEIAGLKVSPLSEKQW